VLYTLFGGVKSRAVADVQTRGVDHPKKIDGSEKLHFP
jgi:hypothetical protein